jgi:hypothetical protein
MHYASNLELRLVLSVRKRTSDRSIGWKKCHCRAARLTFHALAIKVQRRPTGRNYLYLRWHMIASECTPLTQNPRSSDSKTVALPTWPQFCTTKYKERLQIERYKSKKWCWLKIFLSEKFYRSKIFKQPSENFEPSPKIISISVDQDGDKQYFSIERIGRFIYRAAERQIRSGYRAHMSFGLRQVDVKRYAAHKNKFVIENIISVNNDDHWLAGSERRMLQIKQETPSHQRRECSFNNRHMDKLFILMDII